MADTVNTVVITNNDRIYEVALTNNSDGTGESTVTKVDISGLTGPNGATVTRLDLLEVRWAIQGFTSVYLYNDHDTDHEIGLLSGNGYDNFEYMGGKKDLGTGGTGDVLLTTDDAAAGASYDIRLKFRKKVG